MLHFCIACMYYVFAIISLSFDLYVYLPEYCAHRKHKSSTIKHIHFNFLRLLVGKGGSGNDSSHKYEHNGSNMMTIVKEMMKQPYSTTPLKEFRHHLSEFIYQTVSVALKIWEEMVNGSD